MSMENHIPILLPKPYSICTRILQICEEMAFRSREMMKNLASGVKQQLEKCVPNTKVVMGRAQRGLFAGRHIQFGNRVSEKGGNT
ncbi:hypothetical protein RND71_042480 [Anisodus tanguticus]|uniref:Uncharacterized protein n=1 Tax=Anisodus tanguticus TaxID=243964 RepID=A0AAE1QQY6_9SOLA|nr:hypothetical protein RND71_042480 [Anisodus tanguticus]